MSINFTATPFQTMITNFAKSVTRTPVTKTTSNLDGDETLTDGTDVTISGAFFTPEDKFFQDNPGLMNNADAVLLLLPSVTINKEDKITYGGNTYRVEHVDNRLLGTTAFYNSARLFLI